jgi:Ca-activated chloride channel family protein
MVFKTSTFIVTLCVFAVAAPFMVFFYFRSRRRGTVRFSSLGNVRLVPRTLKHRLRHVPMIARLLVLAFLLVGVARPRIPNRESIVSTEGVAIQMVIDRSSSMREKMEFEGRSASRFDVVRKVFTDFVMGDKRRKLLGRPSDLLGLTSFALYPEENCPLTLDHKNLVAFMETIEPVPVPELDRFGRAVAAPSDDGTAIGDALYHAVLHLINAEEALEKHAKSEKNYKIKSKTIILLTDGLQNAGEYRPVDAAEAARDNGIKIYSIAVVPGDVRDDTDLRSFFMSDRFFDTREIRAAAEMTKGKFYKATDGESLVEIYKEIDKLEKSTLSERVSDYDEQFQSWWAVPMGLCLLTVEIILRNTLFRALP